MTVYLSLEQVLELHRLEIRRFGGRPACATEAASRPAWRGRR